MPALLAPIFALAFNVLCQMLTVHITKRIGLSIIAGLIAGLLATAALCFAIETDFAGWIVELTTTIALSYCFWVFLNLNITALRIRILRELLLSPGHAMARTDLDQIYHPQEMLDRRLARLLASGDIVLNADGRYTLAKSRLLHLARLVNFVSRFVIPR